MILVFGIIILIKGLLSFFFNLENIPGLGGKSPVYYDKLDDGFLIGIIEIVIGIIIIIYAIKRKRKFQSIKYSKCPKCKESYNYPNLENGICPKCNIKTIDLEKYYNKDEKKEIWEELD